MTEVAEVTFVDDYAPSDDSLAAAASALERSQPVTIRWPRRTADVLQRKEAGRATILEDLTQRGGSARGVEQFEAYLASARRFASAGFQLPRLWAGLASVNATPDATVRAIGALARFANLHILAAISNIALEDERLGLENELQEAELNKLYNSGPGHRAMGTADLIYAVDVEVAGPTTGNYIFAPASLIKDLRVGDEVHGELLTCWAIPQSEVDLLGKDITPNYRELKVWHVRDDASNEI